jgi:hypothetical protein
MTKSHLIALSLMTNGVIANAASIAYILAEHASRHCDQLREDSTFLSSKGNALLLIANEAALLRELDVVIADGRVSEAYAIPVFISMVCRRSQLLDHACYRVCDGREKIDIRFKRSVAKCCRVRGRRTLLAPCQSNLLPSAAAVWG